MSSIFDDSSPIAKPLFFALPAQPIITFVALASEQLSEPYHTFQACPAIQHRPANIVRACLQCRTHQIACLDTLLLTERATPSKSSRHVLLNRRNGKYPGPDPITLVA